MPAHAGLERPADSLDRGGRRRRPWRRGSGLGCFAASALLGLLVGWAQPARPSSVFQASAVAAQEQASPGFLALPLLNHLGESDVCRSLVGLQNLGDEATQAVAVVWGRPRPGLPCAGPLAVECSGLLAPGATWSLLGAQIPAGSQSAMVFSVSARRLSELGLDLGFEASAASHLCATLSGATFLGDCGAFEHFRSAWSAGGSFAGLPLGRVAGPPLAAQVLRHCPGRMTPGVQISAGYGAGWQDATPEGSRQISLAGPLRIPASPGAAFVTLQNLAAGLAQASVSFHALGSCEPARACGQLAIHPGEAAYLPLTDCAPAGSEGGLSIQSDTALAVAVDLASGDSLSTLEGSTAADWGLRLSGAPSPDPARGWSTVVYVQSPPGAPRQTRVRVEHLGPDGEVLDSQEQPLCPGGVLAFSRPSTAARPGGRSGSLRVTSLDELPIAASLHLQRGDGRGGVAEAAALPLLPEPPGEAGLIQSLPLLAKDLDGTGLTTNLVLANHSVQPGWAELALLAYDASGPLEVRCLRLGAGQVDSIDIDNFYQAPKGFVGGLVVSPVWWSHADPEGMQVPPSLSATLLLRTGARDGENFPGDELAISRGVRLTQAPAFLRQAAVQRCRPLPQAPPPGGSPPDDSGLREEAGQAMAWLPALAYLGQNASCQATVTVTNQGERPAQLLWLAWTEPGFCPPRDAGPAAYGCSGLLAPQGSWVLDAGSLPNDANGGLIYSLSTASLQELGLDPASPEPIAAALCRRLPALMDSAAPAEGRLRQAFQTGGRFADLPLDKAWGPPITATVSRSCPGDQTPGTLVTDDYAATRPDRPSDLTGTHRYAVQPILADFGGLNSILYIQNIGLSCASVSLDFRHLGDCLYSRRCRILSLGPGESYAFDASDCLGPVWQGSLVISANEPLAFALDRVGRDQLRTMRELPSALPYDLDGNGQLGEADVDRVRAALGSKHGDPGWDDLLDLVPDDQIDAADVSVASTGLCRPAQPSGPALPRPDAAAPRLQTFLPTLTGDGSGRPGCQAQVAIQNLGQVAAKAIVLLWTVEASGAAECTGPSRVECSPLLAPGSSWLLPQAVLAGAGSAVVFGVDGRNNLFPPFPARTGRQRPSFDDTWADLLCETLVLVVVDDCAAYRQFKGAWDSKGSFSGIPFDKLPAVPLGIRVERDCASAGRSAPSGRRERSAYGGLDAAQLGAWDEAAGAYVSTVPVLYGNKAGLNTRLWLQNAGVAAAQVEVWLQAQNDCTGSRRCKTLTVQPGAAATVDPALDCRLIDWQGSAWLRSTAPIAVLAETDGRGVRLAAGAPMRQPPLGAAPSQGGEEAATTLFGPLIPYDREGWDLGINVQNQSLSQEAWVEVTFLDRQGAPVSSLDARICAGDTETFFLPMAEASAERLAAAGTVRVRSRPPAGRGGAGAAPIAGVLLAYHFTDPSRQTALEAFAYPLLSNAAVGPWPLGEGRRGTGVLALPGLVHQPGPEGETSHLLLSNLAGLPGETAVDITLFDDQGQVAKASRRLAAGAVEAIPLADLGVPAGFRGAATVSAVSWTHRRPDRPADAPTVALAAAALTWVGADDATDLKPGPRLAVEPGIPLAWMPGGTQKPVLRERAWLPLLSKGR